MQTGWLRYKCWQGQGSFHTVSQAAHILFLPLTQLHGQLKSLWPLGALCFMPLVHLTLMQGGVGIWDFSSPSSCYHYLQE